MLKRIGALSVLLVLFFHPLAFAHEGKPHIIGTVTALDAQHLVVQTKEGKTLSILLSKATKDRKGEATAAGADLKVGDRVVVDVTGEGETLTAGEIRFSSAGGKTDHEGMTHRQTSP